MRSEVVAAALERTFGSLPEEAAAGLPVYRGKVRDVVVGKDRLLLVASDRLSAFDRVLSTVPFKGEVLARIAAFWFRETADLVPNHVIGPEETGGLDVTEATGRCALVRKADMLPVEVVVRGYLSGSAWRDYREGRPVSGLVLPSGLERDEKFPVPILTPSTKEAAGHDRPVSGAELVASGIVERELWVEVERAALSLFRRGQELAARRGLILVDTKYEFGLVDGRLVVADEIHTPDSSRYWYADGYAERFTARDAQRELDKEAFRRWLMDRGWSGDGEPPSIPDELRVETALRYVRAFEAITGEKFVPVDLDPQALAKSAADIARGHVAEN
ncbi:MAG: phosphoribosylaminoimidazolesuccinocarboxamide synthase [Spirochaetia bacterium]|nr:phosphoribosylaminoimidazolesuccinocarboxamide synthase [Spirochaetia bacterium]